MGEVVFIMCGGENVEYPIKECPHCGKIGGFGMLRWHFENCKYKGNDND